MTMEVICWLCTHGHLVKYELCSGGNLSGAFSVKGDSCAGDSLPYEEWEQIA